MKRPRVGFKEDFITAVDQDDGLLKQRKYSRALKNNNITCSTPEIISRQASQNVAVVGSKGAGVTRFIDRMINPQLRNQKLPDSSENPRPKSMTRNHLVSIHNAKLYKCTDPSIPRPECYRSYPSYTEDTIVKEHLEYVMLKHVAFLDYPNHCNFVSCLLTGSTNLDAVILVVSSDEPFSHQIATLLNAISRAGIDQLIILQNKVDKVGREQAMENYDEIQNCIQKCGFAKAPIIPISVKKDKNVDVVIDMVCNYFKPRERDHTLPMRLLIHYSMDPNPENISIEKLKGGAVGGQILQGCFRVGQKVEIRPGILYKKSSKNKAIECLPIKAQICELFSEKNALQVAISGGLVGLCTGMDPALCSRNKLHGQIVGNPGTLPEIWSEILLNVELFPTSVRSDAQEGEAPSPIEASERLHLNAGGQSAVGTVVKLVKEGVIFHSKNPVCCSIGDTVSVSRFSTARHGHEVSSWNLIGVAKVAEGVKQCSIYDPKLQKNTRALPRGSNSDRRAVKNGKAGTPI